MKTFAQYIEEGRDAPLYHGTSIVSFMDIIRDGKLHSGGANALYPGAISMSRSLAFAGKYKGPTGLVFQFDQRRLAQNFKIVPYNDFAYLSRTAVSEYEEVVVAPKGIHLKYVDKVLTSMTKDRLFSMVTSGLYVFRALDVQRLEVLDDAGMIEYGVSYTRRR